MRNSSAGVEQAYLFLQQKRLAEAETVCREVLTRAPRDAEALHLFGLIRKQIGDIPGSERLLRQSIELEPRRAEFHANLGNLLRGERRLDEAAASYRVALALDRRHNLARLGLARTLDQLEQHASAEAECRTLIAMNRCNTQAWSTLAAALRGQHRVAEAEAAYRHAIALQPDYAVAHHNLGALLSQMDRAEEALAELDRAQRLGLKTREIAVNRGNALLKLYRLEEAEQSYATAVDLEPRDIDAQKSLARLRYMRGDPKFTRSMVAAAALHPDALGLQLMFSEVLRSVGDLHNAEIVLRDLIGRKGPVPELRSALAAVLHEDGRLQEAQIEALAATTERPYHPAVIENLVCIQLGQGRAEDARALIRTQRARQPDEQRWIAYEALAARLQGDSLYGELYDYRNMVRCYELDAPPGWRSMAQLNAALEAVLGARHRFAMHPFDQSLRNGSQTARSLLTDDDPVIRDLIQAFSAPLAEYVQLIGTAATHPLSARNTGASVIDKCWSVQLRRQGFHLNHIHPEGWISSAYYVAVPDEVEDTASMSGWIKFGEPRWPVPGCVAERIVQPRAGRLVLFPSYMWHGTNPIHGSVPRTTIAFDAIPAKPAG